MAIEKKDHVLLMKLFYQDGYNNKDALRKHSPQKRLRRGPVSHNALKNIVKKFEVTGNLGWHRKEAGVASP